MGIDIHGKVDKEDRPLTRADVDELIHEVGGPDKLVLIGRNLSGINLTNFDLRGADLYDANLIGTDLRGADLTSRGDDISHFPNP